jgi:phospholipid transport system substrate-binding protein
MKMTMTFWRRTALVLIGAALMAQAQAAPVAPDQLMKQLTDDVLATVKTDKEIQAGNLGKINALVESKIMPYVDFQKMTANAVGRFWNDATAQQKQLTDQFRQLLTYTYSGALASVRDQQIQFGAFRGDPADPVAEVRSKVINPKGGQSIQLNYRLEKAGDSWKIVDVNVQDFWLVQTYRGTFASEINRNGVDGLIKSLVDKNKTMAAQKS